MWFEELRPFKPLERHYSLRKGNLTILADLPRKQSLFPDIVCLSHLRWNWVYQRPQHLMTRAAKTNRVLFLEEPVSNDDGLLRLELTYPHSNITVATPQIPRHLTENHLDSALRILLDQLLRQQLASPYLLWYYTPMALRFSSHLKPLATVYDCMDQLSAFAGASSELMALEQALLSRTDIVFTGGKSLFEAKRGSHHNVHCFPSSVDMAHFETARRETTDSDDQKRIPRPRLGYFGVIDERLDLFLIASLAQKRPNWHVVLVGPVTKIDERLLPRAPNIHYLGKKRYEELPAYVGGWDVALMPFAKNESTQYISPTKTPEYLAAGKPVVSTSIRDVVHTYGEPGFVRIADEVEPFITAIENSLLEDPLKRISKVDAFLKEQSWDHTWNRMQMMLDQVLAYSTASAKAA
jgi:UDP-galactopyranose mutase